MVHTVRCLSGTGRSSNVYEYVDNWCILSANTFCLVLSTTFCTTTRSNQLKDMICLWWRLRWNSLFCDRCSRSFQSFYFVIWMHYLVSLYGPTKWSNKIETVAFYADRILCISIPKETVQCFGVTLMMMTCRLQQCRLQIELTGSTIF